MFSRGHRRGCGALRRWAGDGGCLHMSSPYRIYFQWRDVVRAEMDAVGTGGKGDIRARVDEQGSSEFLVLSSHLIDEVDGFMGQEFQFSSREIFFAELNVVDSGAGGLVNLFEEAAAAAGFIRPESSAVGDVVDEAAVRDKCLHGADCFSFAPVGSGRGFRVEPTTYAVGFILSLCGWRASICYHWLPSTAWSWRFLAGLRLAFSACRRGGILSGHRAGTRRLPSGDRRS